jgi:hypothetical protein
LKIKNDTGSCLKHGDKVNFLDFATSASYFIEADTQDSFWSGSWKDYLYLGKRGPNDPRTIFQISMNQRPSE